MVQGKGIVVDWLTRAWRCRVMQADSLSTCEIIACLPYFPLLAFRSIPTRLIEQRTSQYDATKHRGVVQALFSL